METCVRAAGGRGENVRHRHQPCFFCAGSNGGLIEHLGKKVCGDCIGEMGEMFSVTGHPAPAFRISGESSRNHGWGEAGRSPTVEAGQLPRGRHF